MNFDFDKLPFVVFSLKVDCVLVGFAICDCELPWSQARGLDCGIVPPVWGFPSARNLKCSHWPLSSFCVNWSALWVM